LVSALWGGWRACECVPVCTAPCSPVRRIPHLTGSNAPLLATEMPVLPGSKEELCMQTALRSNMPEDADLFVAGILRSLLSLPAK